MAFADRLKLPDLAFWCYTLAIVCLPLALGGNRELPLGLVQAGLALSCFVMICATDEWRRLPIFPRVLWALGLLTAVALWALAQTLPIFPVSLVHPVWPEAATALGRPLGGVVAIAPEDSIKGLSRFITYIAAGILGYAFAQNAERARLMMRALWISGVIVCLYGLLMYGAGTERILWMEKWAYEDDLTATFVNRNHFAVYAGLVLVCGTSLLMESWRKNVGEGDPRRFFRNLHEWLPVKGMPQAVLLALVLLSVFLSHSRAGLMLDVAGVGAYLFFDQIYRKAWRRAVVIGFCALVVLALVFVFAQQFSVRFSHLFNDYSSHDRLKVFGWTLAAIRDNPWLGFGLNGFQPVFRLYQRDMIMEFNHVHSDVLESLLDFGVPMALALWAAVGLMLSGLLRGIWTRRQHGAYPAAALAASVIVLGHATVDFDMQIPGVVMPWAMLMGAGLAHSWRQSEKQEVTQGASLPRKRK